MLVLFVGGSLVSESESALPGERLYSLKRTLEGLSLATSITESNEAEIQVQLVRERLEEVRALIADGRIEDVSQSVTELQEQVESATEALGVFAIQNPDQAINMADELSLILANQRNFFFVYSQNAPPSISLPLSKVLVLSDNFDEEVDKVFAATLPTPTTSAPVFLPSPTPTHRIIRNTPTPAPTREPDEPTITPRPTQPPPTSTPVPTERPTATPTNTPLPTDEYATPTRQFAEPTNTPIPPAHCTTDTRYHQRIHRYHQRLHQSPHRDASAIRHPDVFLMGPTRRLLVPAETWTMVYCHKYEINFQNSG
jgi:hypothetical protein